MMPKINVAPMVLTALTLLTGCASYQRKPIDIGTYLADWTAIEADDQRVRDRARLVGAAYDASNGLDLSEATLVALVLNPMARAARIRAEAVSAGVGFAGSWSDPTLSTELRRAVSTGTSPWIVSAGLSITIPLSGRLSAERDGAVAKASAARLAALLVEHDLRLAVSQAWFDWSFAVERTRLLRQYQEALTPLLGHAERLATAGELSGERLGILRIEVTEHRIQVAQADARSRERHARLLGVMGLTPVAEVALQPTLDAGAPPANTPAGWPERQTRVQLQLAEYEVSEQALRREVARQYPDLTIGPSFEFDQGQSSIGLALGLLPVPLFNRNREGIAKATGHRSVVRALVGAALQQVVSETQRLRSRAARASQRLQALAEFAGQIDEQLSRLLGLARQGELDVLVLRHVLQSGLRNRLGMAETRRDLALARTRLSNLLTVEPEPKPAPRDGDAP